MGTRLMRNVGTEKKTARDGKEIVIQKMTVSYPNSVCKECKLRTRKNGSSRCEKCAKPKSDDNKA